MSFDPWIRFCTWYTDDTEAKRRINTCRFGMQDIKLELELKTVLYYTCTRYPWVGVPEELPLTGKGGYIKSREFLESPHSIHLIRTKNLFEVLFSNNAPITLPRLKFRGAHTFTYSVKVDFDTYTLPGMHLWADDTMLTCIVGTTQWRRLLCPPRGKNTFEGHYSLTCTCRVGRHSHDGWMANTHKDWKAP